MPAGEDPVHRAHPARRRHHQLGPSVPRPRPARPGIGLQRPNDRRAHGDHPPSAGTGGVDAPGRRRRDPVALGGGELAGLGRGDPGVQHDRRQPDAGGDQLGHQPVGEAAPGARHLGAARHRGEDRLIVLDRPALGGAPVADGAAVGGQVTVDAARQGETGAPQAHPTARPASRCRAELHRAALRGAARQPLGRLDAVRHAAHPAPPPQLHQPVAVGKRGGQVHQEPVGRLQGGGKGGGEVHHQQIPRAQVARQPAHGVVAARRGRRRPPAAAPHRAAGRAARSVGSPLNGLAAAPCRSQPTPVEDRRHDATASEASS